VVRLRDDAQFYCDYIYDKILLEQTAEALRGCPIDEEDVLPSVEAYFARLHKYKDTGSRTTVDWSKFNHEELNISRLLRGDQDQVSFVVGGLDRTLRKEVEATYNLRDRWERRRQLRSLAPRIANVTVSAWKSRRYTPSDIADPMPAGKPDPAFWFLLDDFYDREIGLCPPRVLGNQMF
jgi:hypothetical protein